MLVTKLVRGSSMSPSRKSTTAIDLQNKVKDIERKEKSYSKSNLNKTSSSQNETSNSEGKVLSKKSADTKKGMTGKSDDNLRLNESTLQVKTA